MHKSSVKFLFNSPAVRRQFVLLSICAAITFVSIFNGCQKKRAITQGVPDASREEDHVEKAMSQIHGDVRFKYELANKDIANDLNAWSDKYQPATTWEQTTLVESLPERIRESDAVKRLGDMRFHLDDSVYIQESAWVQDVAKWATERKSPGNYRYMIESARKKMNDDEQKRFASSRNLIRTSLSVLHPDLSREVADEAAVRAGAISELDQLTRSLQLFDWTVRNVQLTESPKQPSATDIQQRALLPTNETVASIAGVPGPGYQRMPWQLLTTGEGDKIEKSRLFIRLLQEFDIPAVMLAVKDPDDPDQLVPWAVGTAIGEHIFLFDMQLGLPIPGPDMLGLATLAQVVDDPTLLSNLDLTASESLVDIDYPVVKEQLKDIVVLIDAPPQSISRRMSELSSVLNRNQRVNLVLDVDQIAKRFEAGKLISEIRLWEIPFLAAEFRTALEAARIKNSPQLINVAQLERERLIDMKVVLIKKDNVGEQGKDDEFDVAGLSEARQRYLTGIFSTGKTEKLQGAAQLYSQLQLTDDQIREFDTNAHWKALYGLGEQSDLSLVNYTNALKAVKAQLRLIRVDASYFLALTHFEMGNTMNSAKWFEDYQKHLKKGEREWETWQYAAGYMKGRSHEALREFDLAIESYTGDSSSSRKAPKDPQYFGNILRTRLLKKWAM